MLRQIDPATRLNSLYRKHHRTERASAILASQSHLRNHGDLKVIYILLRKKSINLQN